MQTVREDTGGQNPLDDLKAQLKLVFSQLQVFSSMGDSISVNWPPLFLQVSAAFAAFRADVVSLFGIGCVMPMGYYQRLLVNFMLPILCLLVIGVSFQVCCIVAKHIPCEDLASSHWRIVQLLLFVIYPGVSLVMLQVFNCRNINGVYYLVADLSVTCYTSRWSMNSIMAGAGVLLYPVGIQVYTFTILYRNQHKLWLSPKIKARYGLVYTRYERAYFYWELTEMMRKLLLTSLISFIASGTMLQVVTSIVIGTGFVCAHIKCQPFNDDKDDNVQSASLIGTLVTLWASSLLKASDPTPGVGMIMVLANLVSLSIALYTMFSDTLPSIIEEVSLRYQETSAVLDELATAEAAQSPQLGGKGGGDLELKMMSQEDVGRPTTPVLSAMDITGEDDVHIHENHLASIEKDDFSGPVPHMEDRHEVSSQGRYKGMPIGSTSDKASPVHSVVVRL